MSKFDIFIANLIIVEDAKDVISNLVEMLDRLSCIAYVRKQTFYTVIEPDSHQLVLLGQGFIDPESLRPDLDLEQVHIALGRHLTHDARVRGFDPDIKLHWT